MQTPEEKLDLIYQNKTGKERIKKKKKKGKEKNKKKKKDEKRATAQPSNKFITKITVPVHALSTLRQEKKMEILAKLG